MPVNYGEYLKSDRWRFTADAAKKRAGYRCQVCNRSDDVLDAHHRTYDRLGDELDTDITVLCRKCHGLFHANKRGDLPDPNNAWFADVAATRRFFYNCILAQANAIAFSGDDMVFVVFGKEMPPWVADFFPSDRLCGRFVKCVTFPYVAGSSLRFATPDEAAEAAEAYGEPTLTAPEDWVVLRGKA